jgi:hypothetical protein
MRSHMVEIDDDEIPSDVETDDEECATDVSEDSDHVGISLSVGSMLTWGEDPTYGRGWTLYYQDSPESPTAPVATRFIPGDRTDVAFAVGQARRWLYLVHIANRRAEDRRGNS